MRIRRRTLRPGVPSRGRRAGGVGTPARGGATGREAAHWSQGDRRVGRRAARRAGRRDRHRRQRRTVPRNRRTSCGNACRRRSLPRGMAVPRSGDDDAGVRHYGRKYLRRPCTGQNGKRVTIKSRRRQLRSTFVWALVLAALVLASSFVTAIFRETPDYVIAALVVCAFVAAAAGVLLNWRLESAHSEALRDPLTGLPNRVLLDDRIEQAFRRSRRTGEPFTLIAIDLDGFKDVNDVRGHRAGDAVLRTLARRFDAIVREADTVARIGGDEFVILSMGTGSDDRAGALVGRLRNALRRPFRVEGTSVEIDGSIGWSVYPDDGATGEELLARADGQMYATKR